MNSKNTFILSKKGFKINMLKKIIFKIYNGEGKVSNEYSYKDFFSAYENIA